MADHEAVLKSVLLRIKPSASQQREVIATVNREMQAMSKAFGKIDRDLEVRLEGSLAKDTWIVSDVDADVFVLFPQRYGKQSMGNIVITEVRKHYGPEKVTLRYAEHPYATVRLDGINIDVVPCFKSIPPHWLSATDRTIYHTKFVNENLDDSAKDQVRILKSFLKGIGAYGAEISVEGFSGFLSELLTLWSKGFINLLRSISEVKLPLVVDVKGLTSRLDPVEVANAFKSQFVVIDPIDKERNVASSVSIDNLADFVWASRAFLGRPSESFFYPWSEGEGPEAKEPEALLGAGSRVICVGVKPWDAPPDVVWGQLHRVRRKIRTEISRGGFKVIRSGDWTDESREALIFFMLEDDVLPTSLLREGPSAFDYASSEAFLAKHRSSAEVLSGPFIDGGRWTVVLRRNITRADDLLRVFLTSEKFSAGLSPDVIGSFSQAKVMTTEQLSQDALSQEGREKVLDFIAGREPWI